MTSDTRYTSGMRRMTPHNDPMTLAEKERELAWATRARWTQGETYWGRIVASAYGRTSLVHVDPPINGEADL